MRAGILLALFCATPLVAQVSSVVIEPASPTTLTRVFVRVVASGPCGEVTLKRNANVIHIDVPWSCFPGVPIAREFRLSVGYLPAGTYDVVVVAGENPPIVVTTFVVAEAGRPFIPTLSPLALCLTAAMMGLTAVWQLRRMV